ncbi:hypothetical protein BDF20DRAFT_871877 [Mycotypha africana]|uniref:uncharacterized protein n=1 Tax=Mycotypha africana TaxID=64632 RepID=UPI0023015838|nr:uncharacterized protein BDF20DRAFT_871877 [Mycotypha africana]KAI8979819.1 hypothetical protein BDF20DRAFT_871877 [Mycotypha africana]
MDSVNHNVLQFVSAAAQVFEKQEVEELRDLVRSQDNLSTNWITTEETVDDSLTPSHRKEIDDNSKNQQNIKELLAEATGITIEAEEAVDRTTTSTAKNDHRNSMTSSSLNDQSIEEKLKNVFHLPTKETLRGEWPCYIVQSAIVPGFMYLTDCHICFYASLPKNQPFISQAIYC